MTMYVEGNPKSKKAIKDMIAAGKKVYLFNPGLGGEPPRDGFVGDLCGPHSLLLTASMVAVSLRTEF